MELSEVVIEKIRVGDGLSDEELGKSIHFYKELNEGLSCLGPEFHLAILPVRTTLERLETMKFWRENK